MKEMMILPPFVEIQGLIKFSFLRYVFISGAMYVDTGDSAFCILSLEWCYVSADHAVVAKRFVVKGK